MAVRITKLQLVIHLLAFAIWGCFFLAAYSAYRLGLLEIIYPITPPDVIDFALVAIAVLTITVFFGWLTWLIPSVGTGFDGLLNLLLRIVAWFCGFSLELNKWKFNFWRPYTIVIVSGLVALIWFFLPYRNIGVLLTASLIWTAVAVILFKAFYDNPRRIAGTHYRTDELASLKDQEIFFRPHPVYMIVFGIEALWGPLKLIGVYPAIWVGLLLAALTDIQIGTFSTSRLLQENLFWVSLPLALSYWPIFMGAKGKAYAYFGIKTLKIIATVPHEGWQGWFLGEVDYGQTELKGMATAKTEGSSGSSGWVSLWDPGWKFVSNDNFKARGIPVTAIRIFEAWQTANK